MVHYEYMVVVEMIGTYDLQGEMQRREHVANFAQIVRGRLVENSNAELTISGLSIYIYMTVRGERIKTHTLDAVRRLLTLHCVQDESGVGMTEATCDVTHEEMLVIEECMVNENTNVEPIIDREWDAN